MNALVAAVCELTGWADGESLRARVEREVPVVEAELKGVSQLDPRFVRQVAERSAVNETYFFRHHEQLEAACAQVVETFGRTGLTVWSAACSTGEEAWSFAMLLAEAGVAAENVSVLGSDLSESALAQARVGRYPEWSFRGVSPARRAQCFDGMSVASRFFSHVRFASHNLLSPPPIQGVHLLACRNALIYLSPSAAGTVLRHLSSALVPGGLLLLGTAEHHLAKGLELETLELGDAVVLRKPLPGAAKPAVTLVVASAPSPVVTRPVTLPRPTVPAVLSAEPAIESAWRALRKGVLGEARALAEAAVAVHDAEAHLVLALLEERADALPSALEHVRRALYLDPRLIVAHVTQANLFARLGRPRDAARARANALRQLGAVDPETLLRAVAPVTARELKTQLEVAAREVA